MRLFAARFLAPQERADACSGHGRACGATGSAPSSTRFYHGVEATGCQAERNFFSLLFLIGTLKASMSPFKVEQMVFLKLNQGCLPEV